MKVLILLFLLWAAGSYATFSRFGTKYIIPYALTTMALFSLGVWLANKKKA